jgi:hypothetical protein
MTSMEVLRVGFSKEGCSLYVTLSTNVAGTSDPSGPTVTILIDHLRIGKPSPAGGRSVRICYMHVSLSFTKENRGIDIPIV